MRKFLRHIVILLTVGTLAFAGGANAVQRSVAAATDTARVTQRHEGAQSGTLLSDSEKQAQRSFFSTLRNFLPFRFDNNAVENDKLLSSVKVFPNPVVDQISLSFRLNKQSAVSIKVMDALGNEVMTLLNQELDAGPQSQVFDTSDKLTNGFYFIRVSAGTETVVKRISVL